MEVRESVPSYPQKIQDAFTEEIVELRKEMKSLERRLTKMEKEMKGLKSEREGKK